MRNFVKASKEASEFFNSVLWEIIDFPLRSEMFSAEERKEMMSKIDSKFESFTDEEINKYLGVGGLERVGDAYTNEADDRYPSDVYDSEFWYSHRLEDTPEWEDFLGIVGLTQEKFDSLMEEEGIEGALEFANAVLDENFV